MLKPVFISKNQRVTQLEREAREALEAEKAKNFAEIQKARVKESQALVINVMQAELNAEHMQLLKITDIDDDDETYDEAAEYAAWKVRELKRIKRDQERRAAIEAEQLEVERMRDMTEGQRLEELQKRKETEGDKEAGKGKMKFMQKYYHKGAFFMDQNEELYDRDTTEATGEDRVDKAALPKVMQVKTGMFGKIGQTKYTHLADQDTSSKDSLWNGGLARGGGNDRNAQKSKRGGTGDVFERPSSKRQRD